MNLKNIIITIVVLTLLIFIRNIAVSIYEQVKNENTINGLQDQLEDAKRENAYLNQRLSEVESDRFVEKEARGKLGLVRENEYAVFLAPPNQISYREYQSQIPNWEKWKTVFRL